MSETLVGRERPKRASPLMWVRPPDRPGPRGQLPDLAIRDGDLKLLVDRNGGNPELFNVVKDPNERQNLAGDHPDEVKRLSEQVNKWDVETNRP